MIRYIRNSYWTQVFVLRGGIIVNVALPLIAYFLYALVAYLVLEALHIRFLLSDEKRSVHIISGCVSFLLIFRLNQCHARYAHAGLLCSTYFSELITIVGSVCTYAHAEALDKNVDPQLVLATQVHAARLMVAMGVALKFHCRVAENALLGGKLSSEKVPLVLFDYYRMKGLLCSREQKLLDAACGLIVSEDDSGTTARKRCCFHVSLNYHVKEESLDRASLSGGLRGQSKVAGDTEEVNGDGGVALPMVIMQFFRNHLALAVRRKIVVERMMNLVEANLLGIATAFSQLDQLIVMPLPLAYLQHCKIVFLSFVLIYPLTLDTEEGFWANVGSPCMIFMALLGFEMLADAMENPLGDDVLDMNVMEMIHELELRTQKLFEVSVMHRDALLEDSQEILGLAPQSEASKELMTVSAEKPSPESEALASATTQLSGKPPYAAQESQAKTPLESRQDSNRFGYHFCWLPVPPHIQEYIDCMAFGDWNDVPLVSCLHDCGACSVKWKEQGSQDYNAFTELFHDGEKSTVTHFLCLRIRQETMHHVCDTMAREMSPDEYYKDYMDRKYWRQESTLNSTIAELEAGFSSQGEGPPLAGPQLAGPTDSGAGSGTEDLRASIGRREAYGHKKSGLNRQTTFLHSQATAMVSDFNERFETDASVPLRSTWTGPE